MATTIRSPLLYAAQHQNQEFSQLLNFHDCARSIDWPTLLSYAEKTIDVMVYFWNSWVDTHEKELTAFLSRPGTKIRLVMSDPRNPIILKDLKRLFPEFSEPELLVNIIGTQRKLNAILEKIEGQKGTIEYFLLPRPISYACQRIDEEVVIYSLFEMYRQRRIDSPAAIVNLQESPHLRQFFEREWDGVFREAVRCDLAKQFYK